MIDCHCHLESKEYDSDREKVIAECRKKLKAVITVCADPNDWDITKEILEKNKDFAYAAAGVHPEFIKDFSKEEIREFIEIIKKEAKAGKIKAIGEVGLDYYWIKESVLRDKQKDLFVKFIEIAKELDLPIVVHSREAVIECISILEDKGMKGKKVLMHLMDDKGFVKRIVENGWMISVGPRILKSKTTRKIAKDCPLENLMLETDSPWFGFGERGTPLNVFKAAEKVAEAKKKTIEEVEKQTDLNVFKFFNIK